MIGTNAITGTLKYIADYSSAFGGDLDHGNYIAIHCEVPDAEDAILTVEVVNGVSGPVTLDDDGIAVLRIADKTEQTIKVVAQKEGFSTVTREFSLAGLTLASI